MIQKIKSRFIPIAMECNKMQYIEIKERLKDSPFTFEEEGFSELFPYIVNNYDGEKYKIGQIMSNSGNRILIPFDIGDFLMYSASIEIKETQEGLSGMKKCSKFCYAVKTLIEDSEDLLTWTISDNKVDAIYKYDKETCNYEYHRRLKLIKTVKISINEL